MADEIYMARDLRDVAKLTRIVERRAQEDAVYNVPFCPIALTNNYEIEVRIRDLGPAVLGQFKAINAVTPLRVRALTAERVFLELVTLSEKMTIRPSDLRLLNSQDPGFQAEGAANIVDMAVDLRAGNIQLTKWMAWQMAWDSLTISYPGGQAIAIDFDLDNTDSGMNASHKVDVSAGIPWSEPDADIMANVQTWKDIIADDMGQAGSILYINSIIWRYLKGNIAIQKYVGTAADPKRPTLQQATEALELDVIRIYDDLYLSAAGSTRTKFLPDTQVLMTAPDTVNGSPIAEMFDGPCPMLSPDGNRIDWAPNPGARDEVFIDKDALTEFVRVTTSRLPNMHLREAFVAAKIDGNPWS